MHARIRRLRLVELASEVDIYSVLLDPLRSLLAARHTSILSL